MRKVTVKLKPNALVNIAVGKFWDKILRCELIDLIKMDYKKRIKRGVVEITLKKGYDIKDLKLPKNGKIVDVFSRDGDKYVCLSLSYLRDLIPYSNILIWTLYGASLHMPIRIF